MVKPAATMVRAFLAERPEKGMWGMRALLGMTVPRGAGRIDFDPNRRRARWSASIRRATGMPMMHDAALRGDAMDAAQMACRIKHRIDADLPGRQPVASRMGSVTGWDRDALR
jgi:hypothetical protein